MRDLKNPRFIQAKALLFFFLGMLSIAAILLQNPTPQMALLLTTAIWSFCRLYYFAFYVVERYVDPGYRFSGLLSFARYLARR